MLGGFTAKLGDSSEVKDHVKGLNNENQESEKPPKTAIVTQSVGNDQ